MAAIDKKEPPAIEHGVTCLLTSGMLSKAESRRRWSELRDLVNAHDPINLIAMGAPPDEYECVVGPLMRLLETSATSRDIGAFLAAEFRDHFGTSISDATAVELTTGAQAWYAARWQSPSG